MKKLRDEDDKDNEIDGNGNGGSEQMSGSEEDSSSGEGPDGLAGLIFNLSGVMYICISIRFRYASNLITSFIP